MLPLIREHCAVVVGFKAESQVEERSLVNSARHSLKKNRLAAVVANDLVDVKPGRTKVVFVRALKQKVLEGSKAEVARMIIEEAANL